MITRILAVAGVTWREALVGKGMWILLAYAGMLAVLPMWIDRVPQEAQGRVLLSFAYRGTVVLGTVMVAVLSAVSLPREISQKWIYPVLSKPVRRSEFLIGKGAGLAAVSLTLLAGFAGMGWVTLSWMSTTRGGIETVHVVAEGSRGEFAREGDRVRITWPAEVLAGEERILEVDFNRTFYQRPTLHVTFESRGETVEETVTLEGGQRRLRFPVRREWRGSDLTMTLWGESVAELWGRVNVGRFLDPSRFRVVRVEKGFARNWFAALAAVGGEWILLSAAVLVLSSFVSWPLAFLCGLTLVFAANNLEFLKDLPKVLEPGKFRETFSPVLYHVHTHDDHGDHHEEEEPAWIASYRRGVTAAVNGFAAVYPDFQRLPVGTHIERREGIPMGGLAGYLGYLSLYVLAALAAGCLFFRFRSL